jgi:hypothetical protein
MNANRVKPNAELTLKELKDLKVLALFTSVWCQAHHSGEKSPLASADPSLARLGLARRALCGECREFLAYAFERRIRCPLDPKPTCKHCQVHCYRPGHRERVREIMRFSGKYLIRRGRLDLLWHYFF